MSGASREHHRYTAIGSILLALSLFALAGAIIYFTFTLNTISKQIPQVLNSVDNTTAQVKPVVADVTRIVDLMPDILQQVEAVRNQVPPILKEIELTRKQIPAILDESAAIRRELPEMLATADRASSSVNAVATQVEASRPLVERTLIEVKTTRESIPGMMDRAETLIDKARTAGEEASQGAVTGFFSGIIMAPFSLVADAGRSIAGLSADEAKAFTEADFEYNKQAALYLLNNGTEGDEKAWQNEASGNHGSVKVVDVYKGGEYSEFDCMTLSFTLMKGDKTTQKAGRSFCKNDKGEWTFDDE